MRAKPLKPTTMTLICLRVASERHLVVYLVLKAMKIAKGILSEANETPQQTEQNPQPAVTAQLGNEVEKNRLFQTLNEETPSERNYLKLLGIVAVIVLVGGIVISYLIMPGVGDEVRVAKEIELAVRDHFLTKEKRTATDITFYQCEGFYGVRVGVETRNDIPNPIYKIATYSARATPTGDAWNITANPIISPEMEKPCL